MKSFRCASSMPSEETPETDEGDGFEDEDEVPVPVEKLSQDKSFSSRRGQGFWFWADDGASPCHAWG